MVFEKNKKPPNATITIPPPSIKKNRCCSKKLRNILKPKPAIEAKKVSAVAAPKPDTNPEIRPLLNVRCKQMIPIGPRGIETDKPSSIPFK